ncbi:MAG: ABC transporter ATP-binding protein/permease [Actinomycetaceae bacterium]|nr:ABC transporter ATP-binding protein/permease [Actinomycetaceae bacterium]
MAVLEFREVSKTYDGTTPVAALKQATCIIRAGDYVAIEGPSGAGKSTFLNVLALLDTHTGGTYTINGGDVRNLGEGDRACLRSSTFAFIFQSFHLIGARTVLENVELGMLYRAVENSERRARARQALEFVGLAHKASFTADQLSGGERQRVAIARAIATGAPIVVADEPTGNLDSQNSALILKLLDKLNAGGTTVVMVTHDSSVAAHAHRRLRVVDGVVSEVFDGATHVDFEDVPTVPENRTQFQVNSDENENPTDLLKSADTQAGVGGETGLADSAVGIASKVLRGQFFADALASLTSNRGRTWRLISIVVIGIALTLGTIGLSQTARFQVTDAFDANLNRRVGLVYKDDEGAQAGTAALLRRLPAGRKNLLQVAGVEAVQGLVKHSAADVAARPEATDKSAYLFGIYPAKPSPQLLEVNWFRGLPHPLSESEVLVGQNLAKELEIGPIEGAPSLWINGKPFEVVGTIKDAGIRAELPNGLVLSEDAARQVSAVDSVGVEIRTAPGAAEQVAKVAAPHWDPYWADQIKVLAPPDPREMRARIDATVQSILLTLTVVSVLAAVLALTNAMATGVHQRTSEFGLRRAIGARPVHLAALISAESSLIGLAGGMLGTVVAVFAVLVVTIAKRWQPVMDARIVPLGILFGVLVGIVGSLLAIRRVMRVTPVEALRSA